MKILVLKILHLKNQDCNEILKFTLSVESKALTCSMNIKKFLRFLCFTFLLCIPLLILAQDEKPTKKQKKADQKKEQRAQNSKKAEIKGKKRHVKLQDKQTQKRMKKNKKKGTSYVSRRPGFFQRLGRGFR